MTTQAEATMTSTGSTPNPPLDPAAADAGDLVFAPAAELARRIRRRALSAAELLDALLAQIARHNPQLRRAPISYSTIFERKTQTAFLYSNVVVYDIIWFVY